MANVNLEFDAITAVILGGVSFVGGVGDMGGTILGIILIQAFNTGLTMVNVPTFWQYVAKGGLLLFALTTDYIRKQRREKELLAARTVWSRMLLRLMADIMPNRTPNMAAITMANKASSMVAG